MEKKTKQRLLVLFFVIGFAIILYPLFKSNKEWPEEKMLVQAPPFPQPSSTPAGSSVAPATVLEPAPTSTDTIQPFATTLPSQSENQAATPLVAQAASKVESASVPPSVSADTTQPLASTLPSQPENQATTPLVVQAKSSENDLLDDDTIQPLKTVAPLQSEKQAPSSATKLVSREEPALLLQEEEKQKKRIAHLKKTSSLSANAVRQTVHKKKIQNQFSVEPAWMIQLGSFKNKENALRLVNQLRAQGYKAFLQSVEASERGTRVLVGAENKQAATQLLRRLETEMNLRGIMKKA